MDNQAPSTPSLNAAVILFNMGGPTHISGVKSFLQNIFNDPLILHIKNPIVRKILGAFIIAKRLESVKQNYQQIGGKSPLSELTFALCKQLEELDSRIIFTYLMRYTPPFAMDVLRDLQRQGVNHLILFSMYPQFSTTTTKSSLLDIRTQLKALHYAPRLTIVEDFHAHLPFYELIATSIIDALQGRNPQDFTLILSVHSLPQKIINQGDPYRKQCEVGAAILQDILQHRGVMFAHIHIAYQSKVGPMRWLEPCTSDVIKASSGKNLIIYPLSFTIDNSETLYELGIEYREVAMHHGVKEYLLCPCLNDSKAFAKMIYELVQPSVQEP